MPLSPKVELNFIVNNIFKTLLYSNPLRKFQIKFTKAPPEFIEGRGWGIKKPRTLLSGPEYI